MCPFMAARARDNQRGADICTALLKCKRHSQPAPAMSSRIIVVIKCAQRRSTRHAKPHWPFARDRGRITFSPGFDSAPPPRPSNAPSNSRRSTSPSRTLRPKLSAMRSLLLDLNRSGSNTFENAGDIARATTARNARPTSPRSAWMRRRTQREVRRSARYPPHWWRMRRLPRCGHTPFVADYAAVQ